MKNKKGLVLLLVLVLLLQLTGCGASSEADKMAVSSPGAMAPMEDMVMENTSGDFKGTISSSTTEGSMTEETLSEQKLIKRVYIDAETEDLDTLLVQLNEQIKALEGYVENQEVYNGSNYSSYRSRRTYMTIRIPAEKLDGFVSRVEGIANVVSFNQSQENVTLQYVATESRVQALEVEQERLLELLSKAENMSDLLEIEARLTDVRYELENVASQLRVLSNQVNYATVELSVSQVKVLTEVDEQTVWQRIGSGFRENLRDMGEGLVDFFVWAVTYSPQLVLFAIAIAVVILLIRRRKGKIFRRNKKAKEVKDTPEEK